ncbi:phosphatidylglycerol lysyltransferase domain-containing protein [Nocardioides marmoriginsengisoli]|uniref:phosphatidylglycerol lysyltransferase domain-containing protein n=1 Tax=Nocardioides marmoriginsengisoli TaxID=661483 RepID=UPI001615E764|nr:phosphatidylglycerol lysyltransferase domain-containing protein [Nocardioides marmoriginsengisoli]
MSGWIGALRTPLWVSRIVFVVGAVSLASAYLPAIDARTHLVNQLIPDSFPAAATTGGAAIGVLLIVLSRGLRRGKSRAWWLALLLTVLATAIHLLRGLQAEQATLCLVLIALLVAARRNFTARPDPRSLRRMLAVLTLGPVLAVALGWLWLTVDRLGEAPGTTTADRLAQASLGLLGIPGPIDFVSTRSEAIAAVGLAVLGAGVILLAVVTALAPSGGPHRLTAEEDARVRALLDEWGWVDSLGYFATRDDRYVAFSPTGRSAVSYRVIGGVSFSAGDPLGHPDDWPQAVAAWLEETRSYGWAPANLGASERGAAVFHQAGLEVLEVGDEAILHASDFTLEGRPMRVVRQAIARAERSGLVVTVHRVADLPVDVREDLRSRAIAWRDGSIERGFAMALGRFGQERDDAGVVVVARHADGVVAGFLSFVPWGDDGLSLDLMRREPESVNGLVELMVSTLMDGIEPLGVNKVSLNFSAFRSVFARGERLGAGPILRAWRAVLLWASKFAQIEALYRSNVKYRPEWVPRFLVYGDMTDLPRVATAVLRAEALVVAPDWWRRFSRKPSRAGAVEEIPEVSGGAVPESPLDVPGRVQR